MGRATKFTEEVQALILEALSLGSTIKDACAYAGISYDAYNDHQRKDASFANAIKKAQSKARVLSIGRIRQAGRDGQWQADAWFLERSDPSHWGRRDRLIIDVDPRILKKLQEELTAAGLNASEVFEQMLNELAIERTNPSTKDA